MIIDPISMTVAIIVMVFEVAIFSILSMTITSSVKTGDRFIDLGQMLTIPLLFTSNGVNPVTLLFIKNSVILFGETNNILPRRVML